VKCDYTNDLNAQARTWRNMIHDLAQSRYA
jgi:hypothetical protein